MKTSRKKAKKYLCIVHQTCGEKPCPACEAVTVAGPKDRPAGDGSLYALDGRPYVARETSAAENCPKCGITCEGNKYPLPVWCRDPECPFDTKPPIGGDKLPHE